MIHEVLLALSGHPSALLAAAKQRNGLDHEIEGSFASLSLSERELLVSIARIADLHSQLQSHTKVISTSHQSAACRAVATAINGQQLARFQDHILEVEKRILTKDSGIVGAYDIVPLAAIVSEFEPWTRRLQWLWDTVLFLGPEDIEITKSSSRRKQCSSAQIINRLRDSLQTGYPDIEETANELVKVAETAWMRQLSTWLLYGRLPQDRQEDFCIRKQSPDDDVVTDFSLIPELMPRFVARETAISILFIGKSLNQIRTYGLLRHTKNTSLGTSPELQLLPQHLHLLSDVKSPVSATQLTSTIASIRLSLSRNTLQELLPLPKIIQYLRILQKFFLLGHGEFALTFIAEAEQIFSDQTTVSFHVGKASRSITKILPKEGEINAMLAGTWSTLSSTAEENGLDEDTELAQNLLRLTLSTSHNDFAAVNEQTFEQPKVNGNIFRDVVFPAPCVLTMQVPPPFDLFLTKSELVLYADIHAYLIALRRAQVKLTSLWKQTTLRRDHPAPPGPPQSNLPHGKRTLHTRRERGASRSVAMRKVWATCGAALFLISEITSYFEGEVVQESWQHFRTWIAMGTPSRPLSSSSHRPVSTMSSPSPSRPTSFQQGATSSFTLEASIASTIDQDMVPHDPETISTAHNTFLTTLINCLLLDDAKFSSEVRMLLSHVDLLISHIIRLQIIQQNLDLEADEGVIDALTDYPKEERETQLEIDRARKKIDGSTKSVVGRLRELDEERMGGGVGRNFAPSSMLADRVGMGVQYEGWRGAGINRLLMRLDFGRGMVEDDDSSMSLT
ncbi:MAG: hypothetical protein M1821_000874 [Bathelium mastoideum]|nr:MAG: hypothetical protein M1821_000874 [Bathelium mastoideum]